VRSMKRFADWDRVECQTGIKKRGKKKNRNGRKNKGGDAGDESTGNENEKGNEGRAEPSSGLYVADFAGQIIDLA